MGKRRIQPRPSDRGTGRRDLLIAAGVLALGLIVRVPLAMQSLWYDEMYTLRRLVGPLGGVVSGEYSPNNHVLYNLLTKLALALTGGAVGELRVRLVSIVAGSLVGMAMAWPLRRKWPIGALVLAIALGVHPWLLTFSAEARGYALMLLFGVMATAWLPTAKRLVAWPYVLAVATAMYSVPVAIALVMGHGLAIAIVRRGVWLTWLRSAAVAGLIVALLYLPFLSGAANYAAHAGAAYGSYGEFVRNVLACSHAGMPVAGIGAVMMSLAVMALGSAVAWRREELRIWVASFAAATVLALLIPLVYPAAGEARFALWTIIVYCMGAVAIIAAALNSAHMAGRWLSAAGAGAGVLLIVWFGLAYARLAQIPAQPVRDAIELAMEQGGEPIIGVYLGADDARWVYGDRFGSAYRARADVRPDREDWPAIEDAEAKAAAEHPGARPIAIAFYERLLRRDAPRLWEYLQSHYTLEQRLPGRVSPVALYKRKAPITLPPAAAN